MVVTCRAEHGADAGAGSLPSAGRRPDYEGGSLLNLISSLVLAVGGVTPHAALRGLPPEVLGRRRLLLLLLDGLGAEQLQRHIASGHGRQFFGVHAWQPLDSVFPATTAAVVTTLQTGAAPAEHGILGWHLNLQDLGMVATILKAATRTGAELAPPSFDLGAYLKLPSYLDSTTCPRELIAPSELLWSRYSRCGTRWTARRGFRTLEGLLRQCLAFARGRGARLGYAYWPVYDSLCHEFGSEGPHTDRHCLELDHVLARLLKGLAGTDTAVLVTADHGLCTTRAANSIDLAKVPGLFDTLATLPAGDARQAHCFIRHGRWKAFQEACARLPPGACALVSGRWLVEQQWYGPGAAHRDLEARVGDAVLFAGPGWAFFSTVPEARGTLLYAHHGGQSPRETRVPLYVCLPSSRSRC